MFIILCLDILVIKFILSHKNSHLVKRVTIYKSEVNKIMTLVDIIYYYYDFN